uniref:NADH-ubiquinone oxidoreductase chain 1 n=1 Tax=Histiostoma feroniarum TaxID=334618 RepID=A0A2Z4MAB6_9ACAR|nr:NADH dehydrogenase subunit 1 [Histiostoma feroniarum]AWX53524.1 NADH dehydrogenase subunit 1 [Histiostoma feroniarum]
MLTEQPTVMFMMDYMMALVGVLLSVALFTLMERKVMGLMHYRKGPSKVILLGLSQPISDALKLLVKENTKMNSTKITMFMIGPAITLIVMLLMWPMYEFSFMVMPLTIKIIAIFMMMGLNIYGLLTMSWGSNSKYAMLGGHRAVAQVMSYEVCLFMAVLVVLFLWKSYSFSLILKMQQGLWTTACVMPLFLLWVMLCLAESNRTPFDMAEGESEIVSGFNIEYGGGLFALIFISEYGMIIMMSFVTSLLFMGENFIMAKTLMVTLLFVWTRCSFPRVRYNDLMMVSWKMALPFTLSLLNLSIMV